MTKPPLLSASPLHIEAHQFLDIACHASEEKNVHADHALQVKRVVIPHTEDPLRFCLQLSVRFGGERDGKPSIYSGHLRMAGCFRIHEEYPAEKRRNLIAVTGASILYGACREMLCNLTARGPHGMMSLPSVSFQPLPTAENLPPETKAAGKSVNDRKSTSLP